MRKYISTIAIVAISGILYAQWLIPPSHIPTGWSTGPGGGTVDLNQLTNIVRGTIAGTSNSIILLGDTRWQFGNLYLTNSWSKFPSNNLAYIFGGFSGEPQSKTGRVGEIKYQGDRANADGSFDYMAWYQYKPDAPGGNTYKKGFRMWFGYNDVIPPSGSGGNYFHMYSDFYYGDGRYLSGILTQTNLNAVWLAGSNFTYSVNNYGTNWLYGQITGNVTNLQNQINALFAPTNGVTAEQVTNIADALDRTVTSSIPAIVQYYSNQKIDTNNGVAHNLTNFGVLKSDTFSLKKWNITDTNSNAETLIFNHPSAPAASYSMGTNGYLTLRGVTLVEGDVQMQTPSGGQLNIKADDRNDALDISFPSYFVSSNQHYIDLLLKLDRSDFVTYSNAIINAIEPIAAYQSLIATGFLYTVLDALKQDYHVNLDGWSFIPTNLFGLYANYVRNSGPHGTNVNFSLPFSLSDPVAGNLFTISYTNNNVRLFTPETFHVMSDIFSGGSLAVTNRVSWREHAYGDARGVTNIPVAGVSNLASILNTISNTASSSGVSSYNARTGAVTSVAGDIVTAIGFIPANTNGGYLWNQNSRGHSTNESVKITGTIYSPTWSITPLGSLLNFDSMTLNGPIEMNDSGNATDYLQLGESTGVSGASGSIVAGNGNYLVGPGSIVVGSDNQMYSDYSSAFGIGNILANSDGQNNHFIGYDNRDLNNLMYNTIVLGYGGRPSHSGSILLTSPSASTVSTREVNSITLSAANSILIEGWGITNRANETGIYNEGDVYNSYETTHKQQVHSEKNVDYPTSLHSSLSSIDFSKAYGYYQIAGNVTVSSATSLPASGRSAEVSITMLGGGANYTLNMPVNWKGFGSYSTNGVTLTAGKMWQLGVKRDSIGGQDYFSWGIVPANN